MLGTLLFLIYINDLDGAIYGSTSIGLFSDDSVIFKKITDLLISLSSPLLHCYWSYQIKIPWFTLIHNFTWTTHISNISSSILTRLCFQGVKSNTPYLTLTFWYTTPPLGTDLNACGSGAIDIIKQYTPTWSHLKENLQVIFDKCKILDSPAKLMTDNHIPSLELQTPISRILYRYTMLSKNRNIISLTFLKP